VNCSDCKHAERIPAIREVTLKDMSNERLSYSLPIYRRNWHIISVLTTSQQEIWTPGVATKKIFQTAESRPARMNEPPVTAEET